MVDTAEDLRQRSGERQEDSDPETFASRRSSWRENTLTTLPHFEVDVLRVVAQLGFMRV
jgi:hypothetical protein